MPYPNSPNLQQMLMQIDQESAQKKANIMQSFYAQQNAQNTWNNPVSQTTAPAPAIPTQNVNWIQVSGVDGAKNQIVQPGQTAWMMDNNAPYFYVKSVDAVGSCDFRTFHFSEVVDDPKEQQTVQQKVQPQIDLSQYVQRDEFEALKERFDQLTTTQKKTPTKANKGVEDNG